MCGGCFQQKKPQERAIKACDFSYVNYEIVKK